MSEPAKQAPEIAISPEQAWIAQAFAEWAHEEVQRLMRSGLSHDEAAKAHNQLLRKHRVLDLLRLMMRGAG